ncbi:efflux RND transporter periplasmic adaptor subunit [Flavihumibacter fluvii]|uniref:efflux RND transporter periplasmic adaptor subunit n=1 Tax=Flavihumibacter fluvii TaxID=2838157 RepID=UPI001BDEFA2F|nr:biotin/lipoyl-binding protein [Flavihumibacter fluvii]ULQ54615.1 biotin/lipoyl-binding protein [Flavihumibacter fluvii]
MKKKYIILLFILAAGIPATIHFIKSKVKVQPVTFITARASMGYISKSIAAKGTIKPVDTVSVGAQVSGLVKKVLVYFNSEVKKGQLLAQIDPSILTAQLEQSKANLESANSNLEFQKSSFERQSQLFNICAISKANFQLALNQYKYGYVLAL